MSLWLAAGSMAWASGSFQSDRVRIDIREAACARGRIAVEGDAVVMWCDDDLHSRRLSELRRMRWTMQGRHGVWVAADRDGSRFEVQVRRRDYAALSAFLEASQTEALALDGADGVSGG